MRCHALSLEEPDLTPVHQVLGCAAHVFSLLLQLWDILQVLWHQDNSRTCCIRPSSATSILEIRSGRRRPSPGLGRRCLMGWKNVEGIRKACLTFLKSTELS